MATDIRTYHLTTEHDFKLLRIERAQSGPQRMAHRHGHYEIWWFANDGGRHTVDFTEHEIRRNRLFCIAPGQVHEVLGADVKGYLLAFGGGLVQRVSLDDGPTIERDLFARFWQTPYVDIAAGTAETLRSLASMTEIEAQRPVLDLLVIRSLITSFLLMVMREWKTAKLQTMHNHEQRMLDLCSLVDEHYRKEKGTNFYAGRMGLSAKRLNELTRSVLGTSLGQLIRQRVAMEAKRELIFGSNSVKTISYELGFEDPAYFSRFFLREVGVSPRWFRAQQGGRA